ncbi:Hpt domain-containing protein, partial [Sneathiella sp.]|uniref:Hpt domain-containing protein n=1 Tax=Sneathiella sp. TaxID=1964365 RepID=UPI00356389BE
MDDLLSEFLTETNENIGIVDASLVVLEQDPGDESQIGNIFRLVHTIKGTCGFLGLPRLEAVAHAGENVLGKIRDRELTVTAEVITIILEAMDVIKDILGALEETEAEPAGNDSDLINRLNDVAFKTGSLAADAAQPVDESNITEEALEAAFQQQELRPGEVSLEELEAAFQAAEGPEDIEPVLAQPAGNISGE